MAELLEILRKECETAINWFKTNKMIVKPDKFQSLIMCSDKDLSKSVLNTNVVEVTIESSAKLLSIEIDNKLDFKKHISNIRKKASNQLNVICRLETFMGHKEKEAIINSFGHSNFNYGCLIWHFSCKQSQNIVKKIHEKSLKFLLNDYLAVMQNVLKNPHQYQWRPKGFVRCFMKFLKH